MTIEQMIEVLNAFRAGKTIQCRVLSGWVDSSNPSWNFDVVKYRIKPEPREWWLNIYPNTNSLYSTRELADAASFPGRTDCIHVRELL